jgi:hypothetical protein
MAESESDDLQLRATEAQMRHALGLDGNRSPQTAGNHPSPLSNSLHPQKRRFVRDGEVPVTVIHRDHHLDGESGVNQLDAARQALRSETTAKERAERSLEGMQTTIHDLRTKLAHERLAKDEAVETARRLTTERQTIQQTLRTIEAELVAERLARQSAENALSEALERRQKAIAAAAVQKPSATPAKHEMTVGPQDIAAGVTPENVDPAARPARRRGRPPKVSEQEADVVEWWVPGWQEKFK